MDPETQQITIAGVPRTENILHAGAQPGDTKWDVSNGRGICPLSQINNPTHAPLQRRPGTGWESDQSAPMISPSVLSTTLVLSPSPSTTELSSQSSNSSVLTSSAVTFGAFNAVAQSRSSKARVAIPRRPHLRIAPKKGPRASCACGKDFLGDKELKRHHESDACRLSTIGSEPQFQCLCGKMYKRKDSRGRHIRGMTARDDVSDHGPLERKCTT